MQNNLIRRIATLIVLLCVSIGTAYAKVDPKYITVTVQNSTGFATTQPERTLSTLLSH